MQPATAFAPEHEQAVIAAIVKEPDRLAEVSSRLRPEHFSSPICAATYAAVLTLQHKQQPVEVGELCRSMGLTTTQYVQFAAMLDEHAKGLPLPWYAHQVIRAAWRRRIGSLAFKLHEGASDGVDDDVLDSLIADLGEARPTLEQKLLRVEQLSAVLAREIPKTPWAIEGFLCLGDIAILGGAGGVGKSWISLYVALCLASGKPLWGYLPCVRPYTVAVVDLESRPWEIDQRLWRLAAGMKIDPTTAADRVHLVRERVRLDKPEDVERLTASIKAWQAEIVIVDSMRRTHAGDENSSTDTSNLFLGALDPIRGDCGCAVILTDHIRKRTGEKELDSPDQSLRGSTDKYNLADLVVGAERRDDRIAIFPSKGRHRGAPLQPFLVKFSGFMADDPEDGPVNAVYAGPLDTASDAAQDGLLNILSPEWTPRGEIIGRSGHSERTVSSALSALKSRGKVERKQEGKAAFYRLLITNDGNDGNA